MADDVTLRSRRSRKHHAGDHSLCRPERCKVAAGEPGTVTALSAPDRSGLLEVYRKELERVQRLDTPKGQHVMLLAATFVSGDYTGAALAAVSKELRAAMDEATRGTARPADAFDEVQAMRRRRRGVA